MNSDLFYILKWWIFLLGIGLIFFPLTNSLFKNFFDRGYIFSKTIGIAVISYIIFLLGITHLIQFNRFSIILLCIIFLIVSFFVVKKKIVKIDKKTFVIISFQEILFLVSLIFWSYIKSFQPDIHGLEKFMDYGFINSILRSNYFPPTDMWFPPHSINYYYFGHLVTAMLIKLTAVPNFIAYNLMLCTIFAFTTTSSFSIVSTLTNLIIKKGRTSFLSGLLGGILTALGGNLHTIYAFFKPYSPPENPVPFWQLKFSFFGEKIDWGFVGGFPNSYWYPNATRFIPFTIHEFPSYSFVVSDLHGHVLDIPFVFLTLAAILSFFISQNITIKNALFVSFLLSVMYMTNAWDGIIYFGLFTIAVLLLKSSLLKFKKAKKNRWFNVFQGIANKKGYFKGVIITFLATGVGYIVFTLPFSLTFKPFVSGIGILCSPKFLTNLGSFGPFLFEADHCQRTPFWMLVILYGFFYFFAIALVLKIVKLKKTPLTFIYILTLILLSTILIATPEFIYAKDIYPSHYRANTMFKLGYQAFIMLSLVSSFSIAYLLHKGRRVIWIPVSLILISLVLIYPYFAITSYFGDLKVQKSLDGISYLRTLYPQDYQAILWIQENISGQPVILESQGDSYTDYGRISANTGLPTPLGWTVHEWLWRGDYSFPQSRLEDVRLMYEGSLEQIKLLTNKYNVSLVYVGGLEREKYPNLNGNNYRKIGNTIYKNKEVTIYKIK